MNYLFIADIFYEDGYHGGAEVCNKHLIERLRQNGHNVVTVHSFFASKDFIDGAAKNGIDVFILGNFLGMEQSALDTLQKYLYFLYEHDFKFLTTRDPSVFDNSIAPRECIVNFDLYKNAYKIVGQSERHCAIMAANLSLKNIVQGYNFWGQDEIQNLRDFKDSEKIYDAIVLDHIFHQKNTQGAIDYCINNKLSYSVVPHATEHREYCRQLSQGRNLVFFPKVNETLSRVSIEMNCLNGELIVNNNVSYCKESWSSLRGEELISFLEKAGEKTLKIFEL